MEDRLIEQEFLKMYIDSYPMTYENVVSSTLDELIDVQKEKYEKNLAELEERSKTIKVGDKSLANRKKELDVYNLELYQSDIREIAFAIYELKIIYAYKYFEIKLKELSENSFDGCNTRSLYEWKKVKRFYNSKGIRISDFKSYNDIFQLKEVSNTLKHSGNKVTREIKNIPEFQGLKYFEVGHLKEFYLRVEGAPYIFITELSSAIYTRLFGEPDIPEMTEQFYFSDDKTIY